MFGIHFNFRAQLPYVNIHRTRTYKCGFTPYCVKYLITRKDAASMLGKIVQKPELSRGCGGNSSPDRESNPHGSDFHIASTNNDGSQRSFATTQHSLYTRYEFTRTKWLGDVIVGARFQSTDAVSFTGACREKDNRNSA